MSHASRTSDTRRATAPVADSPHRLADVHDEHREAGQLYLWFPVGLAMRKVRGFLRGVDRPFAATTTGALSIASPEGFPWDLLLELADLLSDDEGADTRCVYKAGSSDLDIHDIRRVRTIHELRCLSNSAWLVEVLRDDRFTSVFQPIVHADEPTRVLGHEALVRGIATDGQTISPGSLFDAARGCGMLPELDCAARRSAIRAASSFEQTRQLFINCTPEAIRGGVDGLRPTIDAIDSSDISRERVVFELTDAEEMADIRQLRAIVDTVRGAGFRVSLDDIAGAEYSRRLIQEVRPDFMKLDMRFLGSGMSDAGATDTAERLMEYAQELKVETIAESVETAEQLEWNRRQGATYVQGFFIARPSASGGAA